MNGKSEGIILKIAVCDDMQSDQKKLSEYISQYADKMMLDIEIHTMDSGMKLISEFQKSAYKIIFLDIYMDGLSGVETAKKIRELDKLCMIIFTTTSPDFRAEGFEVGAIHYLLKPLTYNAVKEALNRCNWLFAESEKRFNIMVDRHAVQVRMQDILYTEVFGKMVLIHTVRETLKTYMPLSQISALLEGSFLQCNRSYIVNMRFISAVLKECFQLENGEMIHIRYNGRQKVKDEYNSYFLNSIRGER